MKLIYCSCLTECQNLKSTWLEMANKFTNPKTKVGIVMARVDCNKEPLLCAGTKLLSSWDVSYYTIYHIKYEYINSIDYFLKIDPTCRTKSWNSKKRQGKSFDIGNQKCALPFNYKGKWHRQCIAMDDPFCRGVSLLLSLWCWDVSSSMLRFWCSTENDHGYHRRLGSKWAYCSEGCSIERDEKCSRKGQEHPPHFIAQEKPSFDYVEYEGENP